MFALPHWLPLTRNSPVTIDGPFGSRYDSFQCLLVVKTNLVVSHTPVQRHIKPTDRDATAVDAKAFSSASIGKTAEAVTSTSVVRRGPL